MQTNNVPVFLTSYQITRKAKMVLNYSAELIFPLLCPVKEYNWFPDWKCKMVFSNSGFAEKNAIFLTENSNNIDSIWTVITYDPPKIIEFLIVNPRRTVERFSIVLKSIDNNSTELEWIVLNTAYSEESIDEVKGLDNSTFQSFIDQRKIEIDLYLGNK